MQETLKYSEPELIALLQQRYESAFSYVYQQYSGALYGIIQNIVTDTELANDVLQEVFVKIWKQIHQYDATKGRLFTWMLNIARNAAIDMVRSKGFQNNKHNDELKESVYEHAGTTQIATDQIGLRKVVQQLKPEQKQLVELAYFEGFTQDEIAKMLQLPLGTVKTRLRSALIQLRQMLKNT